MSSFSASRFSGRQSKSSLPMFRSLPEDCYYVSKPIYLSPSIISSSSSRSYSIESVSSKDSSSSSSSRSPPKSAAKTIVYLLIPLTCILLVVCLGLTLIIIIPSHHVQRSGNHRHNSSLSNFKHHFLNNRKHVSHRELEAKESEVPEPIIDKDSHAGSIANSSLGPVAETKDGIVYGTEKSVLGKTINVFLGIPYAVPPVGNLRFRKPVKIPSWGSQAIDAKKYSSPCIQFVPKHVEYTPWISPRPGSEDCLYLNIWSPASDSSTKEVNKASGDDDSDGKTVMVWFHGGAFFSGSADLDLYNGEVLASIGDVVVVSVNYRLGALGFLTTVHDSIAGNMGMYDQVLALNWIKENIFAFGGDSDNIVLFGQSAGATSVGLHLFSPLSNDISSRVILESGSPLFPKIYFENQIEKGNIYLHEVGCYHYQDNNNLTEILPDEVIDCLTNLPVETIVRGHEKLVETFKIPFFPHSGDEFLPELPHDLVHDFGNIAFQEKTEILMGNNEDEGSFFLHFFFPDIFPNKDISHINLTLSDATSYITKAYSFIPDQQAQVMSQFFLAASTHANKSTLLKTTYDIIGDSGFVCPAVVFSELMSDFNVSVYHYLMTGRPSSSKWNPWMGSTHLDEVQFVFGLPLRQEGDRFPFNYTQEERDFSRRIIDSWTMFAKTGKLPKHLDGIQWPVYTKDTPAFMEMDARSSKVVYSSPHRSSCDVWKIIYDSFL